MVLDWQTALIPAGEAFLFVVAVNIAGSAESGLRRETGDWRKGESSTTRLQGLLRADPACIRSALGGGIVLLRGGG